MQNFVLISPNFPDTYYMFAEALKINGFRVLGVGDCPYERLSWELKSCLDDYYCCSSLENFEEQKAAVQLFTDRYGQIDYLESNNEYWLSRDAELRQIFNIPNGVRPEELKYWQHKSLMKEYYRKGGARVADFVMVTDKKSVLDFVAKVGYPIFIKPDIGVGAAGDYKIDNEEELDNFFATKEPWITYICEQFLFGDIISFDGICESNSNVVFCASNFFPPSVADVVKQGKDLFYYTLKKVPADLLEIGQNVVKAFGVKKRFFHLEFFRLSKAAKNVGKKGDIVALETNMRPAGGFTPDLINFSQSVNCYQIWADVMAFDENRQDLNMTKYYAACASRRNGVWYQHSDSEIFAKYRNQLSADGYYPHVLSGAMGDRFFMAKLNTINEVEEFREFVESRL